MITKIHIASALLLISATMYVTSGCGKAQPTAQVRGKVICKTGALPKTSVRMVRFEPTSDSKAIVRKGASGSINDDGSFELYTRRPGDGVHHGDYAVTFAFFKSALDHESPILPKYTHASTSPYRVTVEDDVDNLELEIEIKGSSSQRR